MKGGGSAGRGRWAGWGGDHRTPWAKSSLGTAPQLPRVMLAVQARDGSAEALPSQPRGRPVTNAQTKIPLSALSSRRLQLLRNLALF